MAISRIQYWHDLALDLFILSRQVAFVLSTRARQQRSGQAAHEQKSAAQQRLFINIHHGGSSQPAVPAVLGDVGDRRLPRHPAIFHNILKNPGSLHPSPSQFAPSPVVSGGCGFMVAESFRRKVSTISGPLMFQDSNGPKWPAAVVPPPVGDMWRHGTVPWPGWTKRMRSHCCRHGCHCWGKPRSQKKGGYWLEMSRWFKLDIIEKEQPSLTDLRNGAEVTI